MDLDLNNIWKKFLERIEKEVATFAFNTWFKDTRLVELRDNKAIVEVPMEIHKMHLRDSYSEMIEEIFTDITGTNFQMEYYLKEELENKDNFKFEDKDPDENFKTNLNPNYTFDTFIVGESNKFAQAIALAVAEKPGFVYNPLFIYSNSGLGKTHLMHAIGNYVHNSSKKRVLYVPAEKFVNDFRESYRNKDDKNFDALDQFKKKYRDIDVLLIDDIQYLEMAGGTQQEFFATFNELHNQNKQIVIASDRSPEDFQRLEDRLKTRFKWGIIIDIKPPDMDLRLNIIEKKLESQQINNFPADVKQYIANICTTDIRTLEGAISRVLAYATIMSGSDITLELAVEALKGYLGKTVFSKNNIEKVQKLVAEKYNLTIEDIKGKKRNANITEPRQIAMYICRNVLNESLMRIGNEFGGKDHTTVMHSVDKIEKAIKEDPKLEVEINSIVNNLR